MISNLVWRIFFFFGHLLFAKGWFHVCYTNIYLFSDVYVNCTMSKKNMNVLDSENIGQM